MSAFAVQSCLSAKVQDLVVFMSVSAEQVLISRVFSSAHAIIRYIASLDVWYIYYVSVHRLHMLDGLLQTLWQIGIHILYFQELDVML